MYGEHLMESEPKFYVHRIHVRLEKSLMQTIQIGFCKWFEQP